MIIILREKEENYKERSFRNIVRENTSQQSNSLLIPTQKRKI